MQPFDQTSAGAVPLDAAAPQNRELWQVFVEKAWLIVCIIAAATGAGIWVGAHSPVVYQSRSVLVLDLGEQKVLNIEEVDKREKGGVDLLNTIANNVKSSGILKRVVVAQNLTRHPYFTGGTNTPTEADVVGILNASVEAATPLHPAD